MDTLRHWLAIKQVKGLRSKQLLKLLEYYSLESLFQLSQDKLSSIGFNPNQINILKNINWPLVDSQVDWLNASDLHHIIHWQDDRYPENLKQISSPPFVLYAVGHLELISKPQIAVVGSRNASRYGTDNAFQFSKSLVEAGLIITSGLAAGIDAWAHKGALSAKRHSTIAVVGTGPDVVYPKRNHDLTQQIIQAGLILSEFPPGTPARSQNFPRRNRIISGLSCGVLVVEANVKSGSLITAKYALEQNREVFAIPSSIHETRAKGCHQLIRQGAKLVETITDILEEINDLVEVPQMSLFSQKDEKKVKENFTSHDFLVNLDYETTSIDELVARTNLPLDIVLAQLLDLELQGLIAATSGGYTLLRR